MASGVLLDCYGTLLETTDQVVAEVTRLLAGMVPAAARPLAGEWWAMTVARQRTGPFRPERALVSASIAEIARRAGTTVDVSGLVATYQTGVRRVPAFPDALPFLHAVDRPVAIVSNADDDDVADALERAGVDLGRVVLVSSERARSYKPSAEPFLLAARELDLPPDQLVHVGDSVTSDVGGALGAGTGAVLLDRTGRRTGVPDGVPVIRGLAEVGGLLGGARTA